MTTHDFFSFKQDKNLIKGAEKTLRNIQRVNKNKANSPVLLNILNNSESSNQLSKVGAQSLLEEIKKLDDSDLSALDEFSKHTRKIEVPALKTTFEKVAEEDNQLTINNQDIENVIYFIALISREIAYTIYTRPSNIPTSHLDKPRHISDLMDIFSTRYFETYEKESGGKKYYGYTVKYYPEKIILKNIEEIQIDLKKVSGERLPNLEKISQENIKIIEEGKEISIKIEAANNRWEQLLEKSISNIGNEFSTLLDKKVKNNDWYFYSLILFSMVLIAVPLSIGLGWLPDLSGLLGELDLTESNYSAWQIILFKNLPLIAIEGLLIYFFKILLQRYYSLKAEILQIENRRTLCGFIIPYMEYAKTHDKTDMLNQFNEIIFKPIVTDSKDIPKLVDGMSSLANLLESIRKFRK